MHIRFRCFGICIFEYLSPKQFQHEKPDYQKRLHHLFEVDSPELNRGLYFEQYLPLIYCNYLSLAL